MPKTHANYYHSVILVLKADAPWGLAPATLVRSSCDEAMSHFGWGAPIATMNYKGLTFHIKLSTETYFESMLALFGGRANLAALDIVTWLTLQARKLYSAKLYL